MRERIRMKESDPERPIEREERKRKKEGERERDLRENWFS